MRFAYADPPYHGMCGRYDHNHPDGRCWDDLETHRLLVDRLAEYDGWALSMSTTNLHDILPMCPRDTRIGAWVKPFASFKPGVSPAYAWEPVLFRPLPRKHDKADLTVRDWCSVPITLRRGLVGAKPEEFCRWLFGIARLDPDEDEFIDLFYGSGAVTRAWDAWSSQLRLLA